MLCVKFYSDSSPKIFGEGGNGLSEGVQTASGRVPPTGRKPVLHYRPNSYAVTISEIGLYPVFRYDFVQDESSFFALGHFLL